MNKTILNTVKSMYGVLEQMRADLEELQDNEQQAHDAKSERWQEGEAGEANAERISNLEAAIGHIEQAMEALSEAHGAMAD